MTSLPDALHVGFSKCASTFLQAFFEGHADIFLVNQSHFFAPFEFSKYRTGKEDYGRLFEKAGTGQVKLESDEHILLPLFHPVLEAAATTLSSIGEVSIRIKDIQPKSKIIIVIRNQVDLIVSRYSEYVLGGGKGDFEFFVNEFLRCSKDGVNYFQNYYSQIIEIFRTDFGAENVLVLLQEELSRNEAQTIEQLCRFLDIRTQQPSRHGLASRRVGLSNLGLKVVRAINRAIVTRQEMSYKRAEVRIPYLLYKIVQRTIRTLDYYLPKSIKGDKNAIVTPALGARIRDEFRDDNLMLEKCLCRDLSTLGYR
ncbi:MAG: sulfotransferase domain-containing protein [Woeseia sp.]